MENIEVKKDEITTWAAKVPTELKNKISAIIKDEELSGKDFLLNLVSLYELDQLKKESGIEKDVEDLQFSLNRILQIFKGTVSRNNSLEKNIEERYMIIVNQKDEEISNLQNKLTLKEDSFSSLSEELKTTKTILTEVDTKVIKLKKELLNNQELSNSYKEKLNNFLDVIENNKKLQQEIIIANNKIKDLEIENNLAKFKVQEKTNEINSTISQCKNQISELKLSYEKEISKLKEEYNIKISSIKEEGINEVKEKSEYILNLKDLIIALTSKNEQLESDKNKQLESNLQIIKNSLENKINS